MQKDNAWLTNRVAYVRGLKQATKQQELLVLLAEMEDRNGMMRKR